MIWTDTQITALTRLWDDDRSASEIGKLLGFGKNAVIGKAHRLGLPPRPSPVCVAAKRKPPFWTPERNEKLTALHKSGLTNKQLAEELETTENRIRKQLSSLGLTRRKPKTWANGSRGRPKEKRDHGSIGLLRDMRPYAELSKTKKCQYIEGEPSADDSCKCGKPAQVGCSECPEHRAICYYTPKVRRAA